MVPGEMDGEARRLGFACLLPGIAAAALLVEAGSPLDAARVRAPLADEIDAALREAPPDVVVLGNSSAERDVDPVGLSEALGRRVWSGAIPGSFAPTWYVLLADRVLGQGHRPEVVVIADGPVGMLVTRPDTARMAALTLGL